jgi:hypothetical protein
MSTTLTVSGFDSGTPGAALTTTNTTFDGVSSAGLTFDSAHYHSTGLSAKVAAAAQSTRGMWWGSTAMGGTQTTVFGRFYVYFTAAPTALARFVNLQSGGTVLCGIGLTTSRTVQVRNVKAASTPASGTSSTVLATNTWHRIEYSAAVSGTSITVVVRIYAAGNADTTTITETVSPSAMTGLAASVDSVMHGLAFSAAQTYTVWQDDIKLQVGSGATWLGPTTITPPPTPGDFTLKYDMSADTWTTSGHSWASLPSAFSIYSASQGQWGYTAPEHVTSGTYADGTKYIQMAMKHLAAGDAHARFGAGNYGCRIFTDDAGITSIKTGRVQWTEEWTGAAKVKTSMMGWFDRGTILNPIDNSKKPTWPNAGERDLLEQWENTTTGKATFHKGPLTPKPGGGTTHPMQAKQWTGINNSKRQTFRVTFLATKAYSELQRSDGSWQLIGTWTDPTYWQPLRGYHIEAALAISSANGAKNDPGRGDATRKISNIKVWSGTDPGGGGTDTTPPTPNPPTAPTAQVQGAGPTVQVNLTACTDAGSGIDYYTVQRAYDTVASPGTPDVSTIVTFDNLTTLQYIDTGTSVGDKVYYREKATDQQNNPTSFSSWSTMLTVTGPVDPPICVLAVAPADGSAPAGDVTTVFDGNSGVIFSAPSTVGADVILVDPGDGSGTSLTINPADGAVDPNTGSVLYPSYPPGQASYTATATAVNSAGPSTDTVAINVIETAGTTTTPSPRDVWVVPGQPAYRRGDNIDNDLYLLLELDQASDIPTLVPSEDSGITFCVDAGPAGPTPTGGGGGNDNDPDLIIVSGNVSVASNVYPTGYTMGAGGTLTELRSYLETAPVGAAVTVVWKVNGSAIGTVTIPAGQTSGLLDLSLASNASDVLTWDVTSIGSTTAGANLHASWSGAT